MDIETCFTSKLELINPVKVTMKSNHYRGKILQKLERKKEKNEQILWGSSYQTLLKWTEMAGTNAHLMLYLSNSGLN